MAYFEVSGPTGDERGDLQAAIVAATVANALKDKKGRMLRPKDFMPVFDRPKRSPDQMLQLVESLNRQMGGRDLR